MALLTNGQARDVALLEKTLEDFSAAYVICSGWRRSALKFLHRDRERMEHSVYTELLRMVPGLEERITDASELEAAADFVRRFVHFYICYLNSSLRVSPR